MRCEGKFEKIYVKVGSIGHVLLSKDGRKSMCFFGRRGYIYYSVLGSVYERGGLSGNAVATVDLAWFRWEGVCRFLLLARRWIFRESLYQYISIELSEFFPDFSVSNEYLVNSSHGTVNFARGSATFST